MNCAGIRRFCRLLCGGAALTMVGCSRKIRCVKNFPSRSARAGQQSLECVLCAASCGGCPVACGGFMAARTLIAALPARQGGGRPFGTARKDLETGRSFFLRLCRPLRGIAPLAAGRSPPASQLRDDAASLGPPRAGRRRLRGGAAVCKPSCVAVCRKLRCLKFSFPPGKGGPALGRVRPNALRVAAALRRGQRPVMPLRFAAAVRRRAAALWRRGCRLRLCLPAQGAVPLGRRGKIWKCACLFWAAACFAASRRGGIALLAAGEGLPVSQWRGDHLAARAQIAALPCLRRGPSLSGRQGRI